jgi:hypothetical protein
MGHTIERYIGSLACPSIVNWWDRTRVRVRVSGRVVRYRRTFISPSFCYQQLHCEIKSSVVSMAMVASCQALELYQGGEYMSCQHET